MPRSHCSGVAGNLLMQAICCMSLQVIWFAVTCLGMKVFDLGLISCTVGKVEHFCHRLSAALPVDRPISRVKL